MKRVARLLSIAAVACLPFMAYADNYAYRTGPGIQMTCSATAPTHISTRGMVWCNSSDGNQLYFTDATGASAPVGINANLGLFNVKAYGAIGNDTADDTTAIQSAVTAVATAGGGTVFVPDRTFKITGSILVPAGSSNVHIVGLGPKSYIHAVGVAQYAIGLSNCTGCSVDNLRIGGSMAQGVLVFQGSQTLLRDLDISGATLAGTVDTAGVELQDATYVTLERVYTHGNGGAGAIQGYDIATYSGSTSNKYITAKNCRAESTAVAANMIFYNTSHSLVEGGSCKGAILNSGSTTAGGYCVAFYKTISAVEYGHNKVHNVDAGSTQGSGIYMQCQPHSVTSENRVIGSATAQLNTSLQVGGIAIGSCGAGVSTDNVVIGNTVSGSGQAGISAGGEDDILATNKIDTSTDACIILRDFHKGSASGNVCRGTGGGIVSYLSRASGSGDALDNIVADDNEFYAIGTFGGNAQPAYWFSGVTQVGISGGLIANPQGHGVVIDTSSTQVSIHMPAGIYNAGQSADNIYDGVKISDSTHVSVIGTQILGARQKLGIEATGTSNNLTYTSNDIGLGHGTYTILGAASQVFDQTGGTTTIMSNATGGGTAVNLALDSGSAWSSSDKLLRILNNHVEQAYWRQDGLIFAPSISTGAGSIFTVNIDGNSTALNVCTGASSTSCNIGQATVTTAVKGILSVPHIAGSNGTGSIPTIVAGTGIGGTQTVTVSTGSTDNAGSLTLTGTAGGTASATAATVTFHGAPAWGSAPRCQITPANAAASALSGAGALYLDQASTTTAVFVIKAGATLLPAGTYLYNYDCTQ